MIRLFEHAPVIVSTAPASTLQAVVHARQQDSLTGVVEAQWAADTKLVLLLVEGMIESVYLFTQDACEAISSSELPELAPTETLTTRTLVLPSEGMQAVRLLLEWRRPAEELNTKTSAIAGQLNVWNARAMTGVVRITWPDAEAFVTLRDGVPPDKAVFMTAERMEGGAAGLSAICAQPEGPCTLARYLPHADTAAQREEVVQLHLAFTSLMDAVIQRYTELVGGDLAEMLMADLNTQARTNGWEVRVASTGTLDTHASKHPDAAAYVYRSLLNGLLDHTATVIGKRLANVLALEAVVQQSSPTQKAIQAYSLVPATEMRRDLYERNI